MGNTFFLNALVRDTQLQNREQAIRKKIALVIGWKFLVNHSNISSKGSFFEKVVKFLDF